VQEAFRACLAGLGLNSCSSLTVTPVFELRRVAVRMHRSTIINQLKSCEARLNAVILIGGRLRKRNSAKQALNRSHVHELVKVDYTAIRSTFSLRNVFHRMRQPVSAGNG
jgi:hypothetical protein